MNLIQTITLEVLCCGPKASVNKVRKVFSELYEEENGSISKTEAQELISEPEAADCLAEIEAGLIEAADKMPKAGTTKIGLRMKLPDLNERITELALSEIVVAKTCACTCSWDSPNTGQRHQVSWINGDKLVATRPLD